MQLGSVDPAEFREDLLAACASLLHGEFPKYTCGCHVRRPSHRSSLTPGSDTAVEDLGSVLDPGLVRESATGNPAAYAVLTSACRSCPCQVLASAAWTSRGALSISR